MKQMVFSTALATAVLTSGAALAGDKCNVPQAEWQPKQALQQKLEGEGWQIRKLKVDDGCYEVYGTDARGKRMEVYFDPRTFAVVKSKES
ncbi:MAG: PepSY domain-containing protein [Kiloniellaceae bacterium]